MSQFIKIQRTNFYNQPNQTLRKKKVSSNHIRHFKIITMTSSSKHFPSITSFISHATSLKDNRFPQQQIAQYCKENDTSHQKITNIFQAYYEQFKWNYGNFNEIVILLSIAMKKIEFKSNKQNDKEETQLLLKKSLKFLEDLITSKMILVCMATKGKQKSICQHFVYVKGLLCLLIPQILNFQLHSDLIGLIENCNTSERSMNFIGINFIVEFMVISTTMDFLSEQSEKKFKATVMNVLENKKKVIVGLLWNVQKVLQKRIQFREIAYPRRDVESSKINYLEISNEGRMYVNDRHTFLPEDWITGAYNKAPNGSVWRGINLKTVIDIYQFLFKLQVFASSPLIEELDLLIPESDDFIEVFSKFLMGEDLVQLDGNKKQQQAANVIKSIFDIKKVFDGANRAQRNILKKELSKICSDCNSDEDQQNASTSQIEIDQ